MLLQLRGGPWGPLSSTDHLSGAWPLLSPATGHGVPGLNKKSVLGPPGSPHGAAVTSWAEEPGTRLPETLASGLLVRV